MHSRIRYDVDWQDAGNAGIWGTPIPAFLCPSDPNNTTPFAHANGNFARGNYGANLGIFNSAGTRLYQNQAGDQRGPMGFQQSATMAGFVDGTSNTVLLWELRAGPTSNDVRGTWAMPRHGASIVSGCDNWGDCYGINEGNHDNGDDIQGCTNQPTQGLGCYAGGDGQGGSKSRHPGGVHALLGDASTRFISQTIDFGLRTNNTSRGPGRQISTAAGGEAITGDF